MTHTGHCISIRSPTVRLGLPCMRTSSRVYHSGASPHCSEACLPGETSHRATAQSAQGRPQLPSAPSALQTVSLSHGLAMRARMLERRRRAAPRPAREPVVPRSVSHAQCRRLRTRQRPHPRQACACMRLCSRSGCCGSHLGAATRRQSRPELDARVDQPRLDAHSNAASHRGEEEHLCEGVEGRIGHVRSQNQQKRAAGCVRVPGHGLGLGRDGHGNGRRTFLKDHLADVLTPIADFLFQFFPGTLRFDAAI